MYLYKTLEEAKGAAISYANNEGFSLIVKRTWEWSTSRIIRKAFHRCDQGALPRKGKQVWYETGFDSEGRLPVRDVLIRSKGDDAALWKMQVVNGSHTGHLPCTKVEQSKALPAARRSTWTLESHEEILTLRRCGATPRIIANKLSDDGVWIGVQDVKNIIRKYKHEL